MGGVRARDEVDQAAALGPRLLLLQILLLEIPLREIPLVRTCLRKSRLRGPPRRLMLLLLQLLLPLRMSLLLLRRGQRPNSAPRSNPLAPIPTVAF